MPSIRDAEQLLGDKTDSYEPSDQALAKALLEWIWAYHWLGELEPEKMRDAAERVLATFSTARARARLDDPARAGGKLPETALAAVEPTKQEAEANPDKEQPRP